MVNFDGTLVLGLGFRVKDLVAIRIHGPVLPRALNPKP